MSFLNICRRAQATTLFSRRFLSSAPQSSIPWFVDPEPESSTSQVPSFSRPSRVPAIPEDTPQVLRELHSELAQSPHLEHSELLVTHFSTIKPPMGDPLPLRRPQGKRKRGGTDAGESLYDIPGSLWNWVVFAQVKEGTENKGAIESVVRAVRKSLLAVEPPLPIPPKSKRRMQNGWAMVDAGDFAVHIISKSAREKYFGNTSTQQTHLLE
ncbi:hypothetical protein VNI00_008226 [Paramarasmius palmivorus]|uniref:Uncharacterized protein n=1 Tax=Paramarasmius palmivorus TaxID=297713 RepID=A0AAW0CY78_9AGAR